jgi:SAM-dependent methyltransferase
VVKDRYDAIGQTYGSTRRADPRIAARIAATLGDSVSVANIGAGAGSYETARTVVAVEPSQVMIKQRRVGAAPALRAIAERLPLRDGCVDAAMALLTIHHWSDVAAGIAEMRRVARRRLVILTWDPDVTKDYWLLSDYFPAAAAIDYDYAVSLDVLTDLLGDARVDRVLIPHDCTDGFTAAYWRRPEAYLDPTVRAGMSMFARLADADLQAGLARLAQDVQSGAWHHRYADLLDRDECDLGYCIVTAAA